MLASGKAVAAEHDAQLTKDLHSCPETSHVIAVTNLLKLGLGKFAKDLTDHDQEYAVTMALVNARKLPRPHEDPSTLGINEGNHIANLWKFITVSPKQETRDPKQFLQWAHLCQLHRE